MNTNLLGNTSRVETPFISVKIGEFTFGVFNKENTSQGQHTNLSKYQYPNYIQSLDIQKVNGALNTYTLALKYQITPGEDPNFFEKVFSQNSVTRRMIISYGDYSNPSFMYKEEQCTITDIKSSIDFKSSAISYTITAISDALSLNAGTYTFPERTAKPSEVIKEILYNKTYGILDIFYGMRNKELIISKGLIAGDDQVVYIGPKNGITVLNYLNYLVTCMTPTTSGSGLIGTGRYTMVVNDDFTGEYGGPYFKVCKVEASQKQLNSSDVYEVDIGYPGKDIVTSFTIDDDQTYSLLYNYSKQINQSDYIYRINNDGVVEEIYSPTISNNSQTFKTSQTDKTWWTQVTQFPIKATLTIKGLLRSSMLMSYVKINTFFFGQKHLSSGLYTITKQLDHIDGSGYRTTLSLSRIGGDE